MQQLKSDLKRTIDWNKYQSKVKNPYLYHLIDPSFQGVNRLLVLLFENTTDRTVYTKYYFPTVEIKDYNVMINRKNFFDQPVKIAIGQGDYMTICLLEYNCFNKCYKIIAIDISWQQALHADPKAIQQINFTENLAWEGNADTTMLFIIEEANETIGKQKKETVKILQSYFVLI